MSTGVRFGLTDFNAVDTSGQPHLEEGESIAGDFAGIKLALGDADTAEAGHLFISSQRVIWISSSRSDRGYCAAFPAITMHAVSQEPQPCIYAQLEPNDAEDNDEEDDSDTEQYPEIRLIPNDASRLQDIFECLCQCAALNPDPSDEGESDGGDFFYNEDEVLNGVGAEDRAALLDRYDAMLDDQQQEELADEDPDQFADPDEDQEDLPDAQQSA